MKFLNTQFALTIVVLIVCNTSVLGERWSRQLSPESQVTGNDWVPIRNAKSISYAQDLQAAPQTNFQFFAEPQNNRFGLQQTHPAHPSGAPSEINSYSVQNAPPPFQFFNSNNQQKLRTVQTFGGAVSNKPLAEPLTQNNPPFQYMQEIQRGPHVHHYQSQPIQKSIQSFPQSQNVPAFQQLSGQHRVPQFQNLPPPPQFQPQPGQPQLQSAPAAPQFQPLQGEPQPESEEQVQLLYVPYDSLYQQQNQQPQREPFPLDGKSSRFNILNQPVSASLINDFYSQNEVQELPVKSQATKRPSTTRRPTIAPVTSSVRPTTPFETVTKQKPHQPPLSMFVAIDKFKGKVTEADVLHTLKNSNSIDVQDSVTKNSPKVFIGPSGMDAPAGYSKFDLPYLSNIEGNRFERKIEQLPFFVAPLSYRTPPGFSKIPLPAPHVGSIVVNQPPNTIDSNENSGFAPDNYYTQQPFGSTVQVNQENLPSDKNQKITLTSGFNYSPNGNVQLIKNEYVLPTLKTTHAQPQENTRQVFTTPRPTYAQSPSPSTIQAPLTKVAYKHIEEQRNYGHSTHSPTTTRTPITRTKLDHFPSSPRSTARPSTTKASFMELEEHKTINEEYFGFEKKKPSYSFNLKEETPSKNFNFRPIPEFNFGDNDYATTKKPRTKSTTQTQAQTETLRPIPEFDFGDNDYATTKKSRTKSTTQTQTPTETQRATSQYTFPSTTPSYDFNPTVLATESTEDYNGQVNGGSQGNFFEYRSSPRPSTSDYTFNRFSLGNEQTKTKDTSYTPQHYVQDYPSFSKEKSQTVYTPQEYVQDYAGYPNPPENNVNDEEILTTDSPSYSLPSELPSISPQLPEEPPTTTTSTSTTTRRPINRGSRRPTTSTYRSTAAESTAERRPSTSRRRPTTYASRNAVSSTEAPFPSRSTDYSFPSRPTETSYSSRSTDSSYPSRSTASRGSKVKYNATSEDRSRFRTRTRAPAKKEEQNIDYQRDVLNQNYPSVTVRPVEAATEKLEEKNHDQYNAEAPNVANILNDYNTPLESVEVIPLGGNEPVDNENDYTPSHRPAYYENTIETSTLTTTSSITQEAPLPSNHKESNSFVGIQEDLKIPQHKPNRLRSNFHFKNRNIDSFYNTNQHDSSTLSPEHDDDDVSITAPTTQAATTESTTTDSPIPRRTNFPRRRLPFTTTDAPTTDGETTETTRTKTRKENVVVVKKIRGRVRQTTSTTEAPETTRRTVAVRTRINPNRGSNRDTTKDRSNDNNDEPARPRFRIRENTPRFRLETQESQWSSRFNQNSFQPIDEENSKNLKEEIDDEQEIVTVNPESEKEIYLFNVSASVAPTKPAEQPDFVDETINMISTTEKDVILGKRGNDDEDLGSSFDKFVKNVLEDIEDDSKSEAKSEKKPIGNEKKTGSRRGVWKRVKVRPADAFETAETQYVGKQLYNSVVDNEKREGEKINLFEEEKETTTAKKDDIEATEIASTKETPLEHVFSETTTAEAETTEAPSLGMFDEARKALTELFSSEIDSDDTEVTEDKLEALQDSTTTTTLIPTTEESTTITPTTEVITSKPEESIVSSSSKQVKMSTSQKVTGEICYRGRCIKTEE